MVAWLIPVASSAAATPGLEEPARCYDWRALGRGGKQRARETYRSLRYIRKILNGTDQGRYHTTKYEVLLLYIMVPIIIINDDKSMYSSIRSVDDSMTMTTAVVDTGIYLLVTRHEQPTHTLTLKIYY